MGEWELFYKRIGVEMKRKDSRLEPMAKLLSLSYYDLPFHLKNCFLYLSIFPEDFDIVKSSEQNITTIFRGQEGMNFQNNVRRLALHVSIIDRSKQARSYCKSIRTLYVCKDVGGNILESFLSDLLSHGRKLVKVLERIPDEIFKLFHLKHLNLQNTNVQYLPKSIGMLQSLQTLNLLGTRVTELPVETETLQHLRHLTIGHFGFVPVLDPVGARASFISIQ
ncbi:hypothetical protein LIER_39619 [Lithospermum erythrorhizon]|uniref:Disease resistance R13L4/SHOC-2-like LRR domain-containing protein n=1 Tax=Lithospermum erythrorhizon TaxID=34254 RepID=A0AAV3QKP6_LITER